MVTSESDATTAPRAGALAAFDLETSRVYASKHDASIQTRSQKNPGIPRSVARCLR